MLLLAVDSATPVAGVALMDDKGLLREDFINYKKTHSETLMPMIDQVLRECDRSVEDLTDIAVSIGPGSFTGLRIGLAAVKGLSMATGINVVALSTLEVLAHNFSFNEMLISPLLDARRQEVYSAFYDASGRYPQQLEDAFAVSPQEYVKQAREMLRKYEKNKVLLLGDGCYPYLEYFEEQLGKEMLLAPSHLMLPRASALADLGVRKVKQRDFEDIYTLSPYYIRLSEAEYRLHKGEL